ncbi:zinc-binding alcohol dehydrogenase family protein [Flavihumibacter fluvii]|uniref:zinc-binding alcohol dehydrogenase family protein n=1 Tax=Flavihumibacter fluvii TaxID=2838157 RepID=UPI001BDDD135|nr:zinc-binding alcohol dehydrogenase family protein [Flavihumibacter fluvii]ULQ54157.1 zinc-binding alcohol dehydrogenase family protein [Flavihumibacter fluvii]
MKAIICTKPGNLNFINLPEPKLTPGHAILKIKRINICGTDLHAFEGTQPYFNYPRILGHELAGELVALDDVEGFTIGESVTIIPYFNCNACLACRSGKPNCCANIKVCGVHIDGGMAEYYAVPSYSLVHSMGIQTEDLAMVEPLAIGAHGIRRAGVKEGEFVIVMGAGPIGLGTIEFARLAGARVIVLDVNAKRLAFAKEHMGAEFTINALHPGNTEAVREITRGDMASVVIDATGSQKAINNGLNFLGHGGTYVLIGLQKGDLVFSHPEFHKRETTLMSSRNATREDFDHVMSVIREGLIHPTKYISETVPFEQAIPAFAEWTGAPNDLIKLAIQL